MTPSARASPPLPSAAQHPSYGDCLEVKREYYHISTSMPGHPCCSYCSVVRAACNVQCQCCELLLIAVNKWTCLLNANDWTDHALLLMRLQWPKCDYELAKWQTCVCYTPPVFTSPFGWKKSAPCSQSFVVSLQLLRLWRHWLLLCTCRVHCACLDV